MHGNSYDALREWARLQFFAQPIEDGERGVVRQRGHQGLANRRNSKCRPTQERHAACVSECSRRQGGTRKGPLPVAALMHTWGRNYPDMLPARDMNAADRTR